MTPGRQPTAVIHDGSCLDPVTGLASLASDSIDVCIMDPPYEQEAHTLGRRVKPPGWRDGATVVEAPLDFAPMTESERAAVCVELSRVVRHRALIFCQIEAVAAWRDTLNAAGFLYRRSICWHKKGAQPSLHGRYPGQAFETIVFAQFPSAERPPCGGRPVFYSRSSRERHRFHPTQKPVDLMRAIVRDFVHPDETVVDAYAGSGSTLVAAAMEARSSVGWELNPAMAMEARRRLAGTPRVPATSQLLLGTQ